MKSLIYVNGLQSMEMSGKLENQTWVSVKVLCYVLFIWLSGLDSFLSCSPLKYLYFLHINFIKIFSDAIKFYYRKKIIFHIFSFTCKRLLRPNYLHSEFLVNLLILHIIIWDTIECVMFNCFKVTSLPCYEFLSRVPSTHIHTLIYLQLRYHFIVIWESRWRWWKRFINLWYAFKKICNHSFQPHSLGKLMTICCKFIDMGGLPFCKLM